MDREVPHPLELGDHPQRSDDDAQVAGDGLLEGEQLEALLLHLDAGPVDVDVGGDDLLGDLDVGLEEGLGRLAHRGLDLTADGGEVAEDGVELLVEDVTHGLHLRRAG